MASDGGGELDPDMDFLLEMQLCDRLHCLPSQLQQESEQDVLHLLTYFKAQAIDQKRRQAIADQEHRQAMRQPPGGY